MADFLGIKPSAHKATSTHERLLEAYENELKFLRQVGNEFSHAYPSLGKKLALEENQSKDPFIERWLEGMAFLSARIACRVDDEDERLRSDLLQSICPDTLHDLPPVCMLKFTPMLRKSVQVDLPLATVVTRTISDSHHQRWRTCQSLKLTPLQLRMLPSPEKKVIYSLAQRMGSSKDAGILQTQGLLRVRLERPEKLSWSEVLPQRLRLQCLGPQAMLLWQALSQHAQRLWVVSDSTKPLVLSTHAKPKLELLDLTKEQSLLPVELALPSTHRWLRELRHFPERFAAGYLCDLVSALANVPDRSVELWWACGDGVPIEFTDDSLALHCVPAVNVHQHWCDPVILDADASEYPVKLRSERGKYGRILGIGKVLYQKNDETQELMPQQFSDLCHGPHYTLRQEPRWRSVEGQRLRQPDFSWLIAPHIQVTHAQSGKDFLSLEAWVCDLSAHSQTQDSWRLGDSAAVRAMEVVGSPVLKLQMKLPTDHLLRLSVWQLGNLVSADHLTALAAIQQWLCDTGLSAWAQGLLMVNVGTSVLRAPGACVPVHASGLHLEWEISRDLARTANTPLTLYILAASLLWQSAEAAHLTLIVKSEDEEVCVWEVWR